MERWCEDCDGYGTIPPTFEECSTCEGTGFEPEPCKGCQVLAEQLKEVTEIADGLNKGYRKANNQNLHLVKALAKEEKTNKNLSIENEDLKQTIKDIIQWRNQFETIKPLNNLDSILGDSGV